MNFEQKIERWFETPWPWLIHSVLMFACFVFALWLDSYTSAIGWGLVVMNSFINLVKKI